MADFSNPQSSPDPSLNDPPSEPLGLRNPLQSPTALGINSRFLMPLGAKSLAILDPSIFQPQEMGIEPFPTPDFEGDFFQGANPAPAANLQTSAGSGQSLQLKAASPRADAQPATPNELSPLSLDASTALSAAPLMRSPLPDSLELPSPIQQPERDRPVASASETLPTLQTAVSPELNASHAAIQPSAPQSVPQSGSQSGSSAISSSTVSATSISAATPSTPASIPAKGHPQAQSPISEQHPVPAVPIAPSITPEPIVQLDRDTSDSAPFNSLVLSEEPQTDVASPSAQPIEVNLASTDSISRNAVRDSSTPASSLTPHPSSTSAVGDSSVNTSSVNTSSTHSSSTHLSSTHSSSVNISPSNSSPIADGSLQRSSIDSNLTHPNFVAPVAPVQIAQNVALDQDLSDSTAASQGLTSNNLSSVAGDQAVEETTASPIHPLPSTAPELSLQAKVDGAIAPSNSPINDQSTSTAATSLADIKTDEINTDYAIAPSASPVNDQVSSTETPLQTKIDQAIETPSQTKIDQAIASPILPTNYLSSTTASSLQTKIDQAIAPTNAPTNALTNAPANAPINPSINRLNHSEALPSGGLPLAVDPSTSLPLSAESAEPSVVQAQLEAPAPAASPLVESSSIPAPVPAAIAPTPPIEDLKELAGSIPFTGTPVPTTPAPTTPAPITPAPITPAPITPVPITPVPISTPAVSVQRFSESSTSRSEDASPLELERSESAAIAPSLPIADPPIQRQVDAVMPSAAESTDPTTSTRPKQVTPSEVVPASEVVPTAPVSSSRTVSETLPDVQLFSDSEPESERAGLISSDEPAAISKDLPYFPVAPSSTPSSTPSLPEPSPTSHSIQSSPATFNPLTATANSSVSSPTQGSLTIQPKTQAASQSEASPTGASPTGASPTEVSSTGLSPIKIEASPVVASQDLANEVRLKPAPAKARSPKPATPNLALDSSADAKTNLGAKVSQFLQNPLLQRFLGRTADTASLQRTQDVSVGNSEPPIGNEGENQTEIESEQPQASPVVQRSPALPEGTPQPILQAIPHTIPHTIIDPVSVEQSLEPLSSVPGSLENLTQVDAPLGSAGSANLLDSPLSASLDPVDSIPSISTTQTSDSSQLRLSSDPPSRLPEALPIQAKLAPTSTLPTSATPASDLTSSSLEVLESSETTAAKLTTTVQPSLIDSSLTPIEPASVELTTTVQPSLIDSSLAPVEPASVEFTSVEPVQKDLPIAAIESTPQATDGNSFSLSNQNLAPSVAQPILQKAAQDNSSNSIGDSVVEDIADEISPVAEQSQQTPSQEMPEASERPSTATASVQRQVVDSFDPMLASKQASVEASVVESTNGSSVDSGGTDSVSTTVSSANSHPAEAIIANAQTTVPEAAIAPEATIQRQVIEPNSPERTNLFASAATESVEPTIRQESAPASPNAQQIKPASSFTPDTIESGAIESGAIESSVINSATIKSGETIASRSPTALEAVNTDVESTTELIAPTSHSVDAVEQARSHSAIAQEWVQRQEDTAIAPPIIALADAPVAVEPLAQAAIAPVSETKTHPTADIAAIASVDAEMPTAEIPPIQRQLSPLANDGFTPPELPSSPPLIRSAVEPSADLTQPNVQAHFNDVSGSDIDILDTSQSSGFQRTDTQSTNIHQSTYAENAENIDTGRTNFQSPNVQRSDLSIQLQTAVDSPIQPQTATEALIQPQTAVDSPIQLQTAVDLPIQPQTVIEAGLPQPVLEDATDLSTSITPSHASAPDAAGLSPAVPAIPEAAFVQETDLLQRTIAPPEAIASDMAETAGATETEQPFNSSATQQLPAELGSVRATQISPTEVISLDRPFSSPDSIELPGAAPVELPGTAPAAELPGAAPDVSIQRASDTSVDAASAIGASAVGAVDAASSAAGASSAADASSAAGASAVDAASTVGASSTAGASSAVDTVGASGAAGASAVDVASTVGASAVGASAAVASAVDVASTVGASAAVASAAVGASSAVDAVGASGAAGASSAVDAVDRDLPGAAPTLFAADTPIQRALDHAVPESANPLPGSESPAVKGDVSSLPTVLQSLSVLSPLTDHTIRLNQNQGAIARSAPAAPSSPWGSPTTPAATVSAVDLPDSFASLLQLASESPSTPVSDLSNTDTDDLSLVSDGAIVQRAAEPKSRQRASRRREDHPGSVVSWSNLDELLGAAPANKTRDRQRSANSHTAAALSGYDSIVQAKPALSGGATPPSHAPVIQAREDDYVEISNSALADADPQALSQYLEILTQEVYLLVQQRLKIEQERQGGYSTRGFSW